MYVFTGPCLFGIRLIGDADKANDQDPTEISFEKGEILEILDRSGKWWTAKNAQGKTGSAFRLISLQA